MEILEKILQDNGNLGNGDEIAGDGVFSGIFTIVEMNTGVSRYIASANAVISGSNVSGNSRIDTITVINLLSQSSLDQVLNTLSAGETQFITSLGGNTGNYLNAYNQTVSFLQTQPGVSSVNGPLNRV